MVWEIELVADISPENEALSKSISNQTRQPLGPAKTLGRVTGVRESGGRMKNTHAQFGGGDLALYAMGGLEADERIAMERHLGKCAPCRRELQELRGDMALLSLSASEPPKNRKRLLTAVGSESPVPEPERDPWRWLKVLSVAVFVVLLAALFQLGRRNQVLNRRLDAVTAQAAVERAESDQAREILAVLNSPDAMRVTLVPVKERPQSQGKVVYVARSGSLVFLASQFASVPQGQSYELWLLPEKGDPISAGVFKPDPHGNATLLMPSLPEETTARGFAVTVEPEKGSTTPTMPILLVGTG